MAGTIPSISTALDTLAGILRREKVRGTETVALSPEGIRLLKTLPDQIRRGCAAAAAGTPERNSPPPSASPTAASVAQGTPPSSRPGVRPEPDRVPASRTSVPADRAGREAVASAPIHRPALPIPAEAGSPDDEASRRRALNEIFRAVKAAPEPRALGSLSETLVFATGNPLADIVLVGEAPGAEEEKQKKPFVGPAGQKLDQILKAMGLSREVVYISNVVKFRPRMGDGRFQGSRNRPPSHEEMATCLPFIRAEIEVVRPKVIVALGRTAAEGLLERGGSLASFRNGNHEFAGIPVVVTFHPSYLLRQEASSAAEGKVAKRQIWEDMLRVMHLAGLPISEKQRGYFQ